MIYVVEVPPQGEPRAWFAFDDDDLLRKVAGGDAKAGHEIKEATAYLERGLGWTGQKIESGTRTAIRDGRLVAGKLIEGTGWVPEEVGKGFEAVGREVEKFGKRVAVAKR